MRSLIFKNTVFALSILLTVLLSSCASDGVRHISDPEDCMKYLFANDLDKIKEYPNDCVNYRADNGVTMLMMAVAKGNMEIAQYLIEAGANVNSVNYLKQNALHYAVIHNQPKMIDLLRQNGAEIKPNAHGVTSLMMAIQLGNFEMVQLLNPKFEDVNIAADDGWTAVYFAIRKEDKRILDFLLAKGACVNFKDTYVQTPMDFAKEVGWKYAMEKLKNGKQCDRNTN
jgi:ankyrin repeat protein